jgi:hypothetical protein
MYVYIAWHGKVCDVVHDRHVFSTKRTPHDKQKRKCLEHYQNLGMSPGGAHGKDGPTDRPVSSE